MQPNPAAPPTEPKEATKPTEDDANNDNLAFGGKDPQTMSQGERMGLSKQQLKKLAKRLEAKKKKEKKQEEEEKMRKLKEENKAKGIPDKKAKVRVGQQAQIDPAYQALFDSQRVPFAPNTGLPEPNRQNILITSALPYVNNVPHLGNIIGCVLSADVYARFSRLMGSNVMYICGTDQYGTTTEVKALQEKKTPRQICDQYNKIHRAVYEWFDISFDHFGRTSTEHHTQICQEIFLDAQQAGRVFKQMMKQCYCTGCSLPLADRYICGTCPACQSTDARGDQCDKCGKLFDDPTQLKDFKCLVCGQPPIIRDTEHFFIDLPTIQPELEKWIDQSSALGAWSDNSRQITKSWTKMGLKPKCITRDLKWGVRVPADGFQQKVFYVWFDAPIGYISITSEHLGPAYKKWWQNGKEVKLYQFMGKDNVPFHTVIFPSSLLASKKPWTLLHHISTTEYLNYEGRKFSKSHGVGVFGDAAGTLGIPVEVWRYYLLVNRPESKDSEFSWREFVERNNNELLANIGNLCHRLIKFCYSFCEKTNNRIPILTPQAFSEMEQLAINQLKQRIGRYVELLMAVEIKQGLKLAMEASALANKYLQDSGFWQAKNVESGRTATVLGFACRYLRTLSVLFEPYMPTMSAKINFMLGVGSNEKYAQTMLQAVKKMNQVRSDGQVTSPEPQLEQNTPAYTQFVKIFCDLSVIDCGPIRQPLPLFKEYTQDQINQWRDRFAGKQV